MHFKGLDLNLIVALDALLTHRNVTRAAQALHLSQSAMSGSLARLREHYDDPLLVRGSQDFRLTSVAEALVAPIRAILLQLDVALDMRIRFDPAQSERHFVIMASDYISIVLIAQALRDINQVAPGLSFDIVPFSHTPRQSLENGEVDLLIISTHLVAADQPFEGLFDDEYVCICWNENHQISESMSADAFMALDHVVVRYANGEVLYFEEKFLREAGYNRRVEVVTSSFGEIPYFIIGTQRVAITHRRLAASFASSMPIRFMPTPVQMPVLRQAMQWHRVREKDPAIAWLRAALRTAA